MILKFRSSLLISFFLFLFTLAIYWQVTSHEYIAYDDDVYVLKNYHLHDGISLHSMLWAFRSMYGANWHPLTWISHMMDIQLYGLNPGGHHATNLIFHILNVIAVNWVFLSMTGSPWKSAMVAALFAVHPLHVEVVAQVAQRKDLLSTFFWFMAMAAYIRYVKRLNRKDYFLVVLLFAFGLMSKPMVVTLPFVFLLMDYWPLSRLDGVFDKGESERYLIFARVRQLLWEKVPLFLMTMASCAITIIAQEGGGAVRSLEAYPLYVRVGNAIVSYSAYISKTVWPANLSFYYPHPKIHPASVIALSYAFLTLISILVFRYRRKYPFILVGWLWYIGTLIPVIGLVQVGAQSMADRYTYVPLIGIFIIMVWGGAVLYAKWRISKRLQAITAFFLITSYAIAAFSYAGYWSDSVVLFKKALAVTKDNETALINLGTVLQEKSEVDDAIAAYVKAIRLSPKNPKAHNNLGTAYMAKGNIPMALNQYRAALRFDPRYSKAHFNIAVLMEKTGKMEDAAKHYQQAISISPAYSEAYSNLGTLYLKKGRLRQALPYLKKAIELNPRDSGSLNNLAIALFQSGNVQSAIEHLERAIDLDPNDIEIQKNLRTIRNGAK